MDAVGEDGATGVSRPGPAIAAAHSLATSHARRSARALDAVFRLTGITDQQTRELAHEAFLKAFPISYRLCRDRLPRPPERPSPSPAAEQPDSYEGR